MLISSNNTLRETSRTCSMTRCLSDHLSKVTPDANFMPSLWRQQIIQTDSNTSDRGRGRPRALAGLLFGEIVLLRAD